MLLTQVGSAMTAVAAVLLLVDRFGLGIESGLALALQVLPNVLLGPLVGDLVSTRDPRKIAVSSSLASAVVVMLYPLATTPALASLVAVLVGVVGLPAISSRMALRASVIPDAMQQQASGYIVATERLGLVMGPLVATIIATATDYTYIFYFEAVLALASAGLVFTLPRPEVGTTAPQRRRTRTGIHERLMSPYRRA
ncbi:MFS transporter [Leifsonia xyli]|nr:MFS transporter [Leifsonia xyli]